MHATTPHDFWPARRVAVTGATGFLGHHVATQLRQHGAEVTALVRRPSACGRLTALGCRCIQAPLEDAAALAEGMAGCDVVFHVAGAVDFRDDWGRFREVNVEGTRRLLATARAAGVRRVVHTSSIVAVGATRRPQELDETATWNLGSLQVPYVTTKREAEELALASSDREMGVVAVNPACLIGPGDFTGSEFGILCKRFWRGSLRFHFDGGNNFVDARDAAAGMLLAAERARPGQRYLLTGYNHSYAAFFAELARAAPRPIRHLQLPAILAPVVAACDRLRGRKPGSRSYLTAAQARLMGRYFFFTPARAQRELGYAVRPLEETLADAYAFWMDRNAA